MIRLTQLIGMALALALTACTSDGNARDAEAKAFQDRLRTEFARYAFNRRLPEGIYRRSPYAEQETFLPDFAKKSGGYLEPRPDLNMSLRKPRVDVVTRWIGPCGQKFTNVAHAKSFRGYMHDSVKDVVKAGGDLIQSKDSLYRTTSFYANWFFLPYSPLDHPVIRDGLTKTGRRLRGPGAILVTVACSTQAYQQAVSEERAEKPDVIFENARGGCAVTLKFEPHDRFAIRGGGIDVLSRKAGEVDAHDPAALACMMRTLMVHKGAVGAWDIPDTELAGPGYRAIELAGLPRLNMTSTGYVMLMYAPFGPGTSRREAMERLGEVQNPARCHLVPDPMTLNRKMMPSFNMPFFENYRDGGCA